ncbi:polymeric immunoglobulin receptor-like isoform X2 [Maylandia zebra]|uniref:polymeric immunoglobulin receptor-like isoform X2 n=1 Tax=Maylandia zebra TaxID=106582 RepID=UPI00403D069B
MSAVSKSLWWIFDFFVFVTTDPKLITAESGQNVTLPCQAPNNNSSVKWSRADLVEKYVLLYQNGSFVPDSQHPSFMNRVDLQDRQMKDGDVSLIMKDVNTADDGTYKCHVFIEETLSWKFISIIHLTVFPDQKIITAESGQNVTLTCRAPNNNKNNTSVEWRRAGLESEYVLLYQHGQLVPSNQHQSFKNRVDLQNDQIKDGDISLILKNVTATDSGLYKCQFFMEGAQSWRLSSSLSLIVDPPAEKIIIAESGQNVTLPCRDSNNNNITVVEWSKADLGDKYVFLHRDGQSVPANQHPSFKNRVDLHDRQMKDGDVSLILRNVTTADDGIYECSLLIGGTQAWRQSIDLIILPAEKIITAKPGQDVTLTCRTPNNNNNTSVEWRRTDLESEYVLLYQHGHVDPSNQHPSFKNRVDLQDRQMKDGDVSLILRNVTINDTEIYECLVFMGGTHSWELSIISLIVIPGSSNHHSGRYPRKGLQYEELDSTRARHGSRLLAKEADCTPRVSGSTNEPAAS